MARRGQRGELRMIGRRMPYYAKLNPVITPCSYKITIDTANEIICCLSSISRYYYKYNSDYAIAAYLCLHLSSYYTIPILVSKTLAGTYFKISGYNLYTIGNTQIQYRGVSYYISNDVYAYCGDLIDTSGNNRYKCSSTNLTDAAKELLDLYYAHFREWGYVQ